MNIKFFCCLGILLTGLLGRSASASLSSLPMPLPIVLGKAQVIVVAKVLDQKINASEANISGTSFLQIHPAGQYSLQVLQTVKGQVPPEFGLYLPEISTINYGTSHFSIVRGSRVLLFLQADPNKTWTPVDKAVPLIKLSDTEALTTDEGLAVASSVTNLLLASLTDPTLRLPNLLMIKDVVDPQVVVGLVPYLNDPNPYVQDAVLDCLATNQQVSIIPRLIKLAEQAEKQNPGTGASISWALRKFTTPEAVPYLNSIMLTTNASVRSNTAYALYKIADKTSIPCLILALHEPDPSANIHGAATVALHRIIPALGPRILQSHDDYVKHRQEQTEPIYQWWSDELNGKHLTKDEKAVLTTPSALPQTAAQLQVMLWSPSAELRRSAMEALMPLADQTTIPYLVLALQDPDTQVAYGAYKALHRLIGTLSDATSSEAFTARRGQESQPLYDWWSDHLKPKPIPIPSSEGFIRLPDGR